MRDGKNRKYPHEFKVEALELLKRGDKNSRQIERELGITTGLLLKWRDRYELVEKEGQPAQIEVKDLDAAQAEIRRLRRELANVEEEREILKKALNIFSRKSG